MDSITFLLLFATGCLTGFLAGIFGVGGGILLIPLLLYMFTHSLGISGLVATHLTFGTSLLVVVFASMTSAFEYYRNGHVLPRAALYIGSASVVAAFGGAALAASLQGSVLQKIFAAVVAAAALRLLVEPDRSKIDAKMSLSPGGLILIGVVAGLVSSLAGVGGGVFSIPLMYSFMHFPLKKALGTSSAAIVLTALASTIGYAVNGWGSPELERYAGFTIGYVDYLHAAPVIAGTLPLAKLGARVAHRTHSERLRKLFAVFLLVIAVKMLFP